jgi:hypothetical protein
MAGRGRDWSQIIRQQENVDIVESWVDNRLFPSIYKYVAIMVAPSSS